MYYILFIHSPVDRPLCSFQLLAIVLQTLGYRYLFESPQFFRYIPRSAVAESMVIPSYTF